MLAKLDDLAEKTKKGEITEDIANRYLELIENYDYVGDIFYSSKRTPYAAIGREKNGELCYGIHNLETDETSPIKYGYVNSINLENDFIILYDIGGDNQIIFNLSTMEENFSCKSTITIMPISYTSYALLKDSENNNSALYDMSTKEIVIPFGEYDEISISAHKYTINNRDLTLFYISKNGLYGIYDAESKKELTPCMYKTIYLLDIYFNEKGNIYTIAETVDDKTVTIDLISGKAEEYTTDLKNLNRAKPQY